MKIRNLIPKRQHIPYITIGLAALILSVGLVLTFLQTDAPASTGNAYLEKPTISAKKDETVKYAVRITPGTHIDTVTATVKYDKQRLSFQKAEYTNSPFSSQIPATTADNTITVQSAKLGGETISTDALIAVLVFKAEQSGSQTVTLVDANAARAGIATNPTVMGKIIDRPSATSGASAQGSASADTVSDSNASPLAKVVSPVTEPIASLLQAAGVSPGTAKRAAIWVVGLLFCAILAAIVVVGRIIYKKKHTANKQKGVRS